MVLLKSCSHQAHSHSNHSNNTIFIFLKSNSAHEFNWISTHIQEDKFIIYNIAKKEEGRRQEPIVPYLVP